MFTSMEPSVRERKEFGSRLTELRERAERSQTELAKEAGCSMKTINNIECGRTWPSLHLYRVLCRVLKAGSPPMFSKAA